MKTRKTFMLILCAGLLAFSTLAAFLVMPSISAAARAKDWVGAWDVEISVVAQNATFPGMVSFFDDGNLITDEVPSPLETSGHGSWVRTGENKGSYTFNFLIGSTNPGEFIKGAVKGTLQYDSRTDRWSGPFTIILVDQNGNTILSDTGTMKAVRIGSKP